MQPIMTADRRFAEQLPESCPPASASAPAGEVYYRLVSSFPPGLEDFRSTRSERPTAYLGNDECVALSVSMHSTETSCKAMRKYPRLRTKVVVGLSLPPESGLLKKTFGPDHHSWWRYDGFDPIGPSRLIFEADRE